MSDQNQQIDVENDGMFYGAFTAQAVELLGAVRNVEVLAQARVAHEPQGMPRTELVDLIRDLQALKERIEANPFYIPALAAHIADLYEQPAQQATITDIASLREQRQNGGRRE